MSKLKRKAPRVKLKKPKMNPFMRNMILGQNDKKSKQKREDADKVTDLILNDILDPYKIEDYKHVKSVANTLDWSAHRMLKAIEFAEVAKIVEEEKNI